MERVHTASFDTPIGALFVASTERGLAFVELPRSSGRGFAGWLRRWAPGAEVTEAFSANRRAAAQLVAFLEGKRQDFELELDPRGTEFQRAVWAALLRIPYGETRSYADVARELGKPRAVRAVGTANGANPIPIVIPCHRVVASGGHLGGYGGGLALKRRLLALEGSAPRTGRLL
jgi:methylated-DNA-[protein]-cysteine S-methyltransferase